MTDFETAALHKELARRRNAIPGLLRKRQELLAQVARIDDHIRLLGGSTGDPALGRKRPKNDATLIEALSELLRDKEMRVTQAAEAVQQAGYKTTSASFYTIVNQTLIESGKFKRVARGVYTTK